MIMNQRNTFIMPESFVYK